MSKGSIANNATTLLALPMFLVAPATTSLQTVIVAADQRSMDDEWRDNERRRSDANAVVAVIRQHGEVPMLESLQTDARWRRYVQERLYALRMGQGDFDGLKRPSTALIDRARLVAETLFDVDTPTPSVVPTAEGDVRFSWRRAGWQLDVEVGAEGDSFWARHRLSAASFDGSLAEREDVVRQVLRALAI